ncbi:DNA adenine methylase [Lentibacillus salinarum]|uniref:site-specific DNA-methyltransferase (adenine-specific) n=1 Tax=Lentibacillus salinarum TaxID=446820 RepID=A0ABW3ZWW8_9BACI
MHTERILKYPGSKWKMANWIIAHMPEHTTYLEPFFGSGAIFFKKHPSQIETINDMNGHVTNLFRIIRNQPDKLARLIEFTPFSRKEYDESYQLTGDPVEDARRFLVRCWQAIGTKMNNKTGWRSLISLNGPNVTREWGSLPERIIVVSNRLKKAQIENQPAEKLIRRYRREEVLIYADPPYVSDTRTNQHYAQEMNEEDHKKLLDILNEHPGPVLLSGYDHPLYNEKLKYWSREQKYVAAENGATRTEVLWINPVAAEQISQPTLFSLGT